MELKSVKKAILDRVKILDRMERAALRALARFGAFVRQRARTSIRPRQGVSDAGSPPSSHTGLLREILFEVEAASKNVVIGPMLLNKPSRTALAALEHGGESLIMRRGKPLKIQVRARPFMQPAFDRELPKAAKLLENVL